MSERKPEGPQDPGGAGAGAGDPSDAVPTGEPEGEARGKGRRPSFAYGTAPALVTDASGEVVDLVRGLPAGDDERFEIARRLLDGGDPAGAREAFRVLAVAHPMDKRYRVYMHYAWSFEHRAAGRVADARTELERALRLDDEFAPARQALAVFSGRRGLLGALRSAFRRKP